MQSFARMSSRAQSPGPAMKIIAMKGERDVISHFKEQEGPDGNWKMPKPSTLRARNNRTNKSKKRKSSSILALIDTGFLRSHIRSKATVTEAHVYSGEEYAATHHYGDESRNIPARPFMWIKNPIRKSMVGTLIDFILGKNV